MNPRRLCYSSGPRRPWRLPLVMAFAVMLIAACGKKGPLYLPDKAEAPPDAVAQGVHSSPPPRG